MFKKVCCKSQKSGLDSSSVLWSSIRFTRFSTRIHSRTIFGQKLKRKLISGTKGPWLCQQTQIRTLNRSLPALGVDQARGRVTSLNIMTSWKETLKCKYSWSASLKSLSLAPHSEYPLTDNLSWYPHHDHHPSFYLFFRTSHFGSIWTPRIFRNQASQPTMRL